MERKEDILYFRVPVLRAPILPLNSIRRHHMSSGRIVLLLYVALFSVSVVRISVTPQFVRENHGCVTCPYESPVRVMTGACAGFPNGLARVVFIFVAVLCRCHCCHIRFQVLQSAAPSPVPQFMLIATVLLRIQRFPAMSRSDSLSILTNIACILQF